MHVAGIALINLHLSFQPCKSNQDSILIKYVYPMVQVLNQDETPLLYSLVFGEGVVNDATSVVLFNAIQSFDLTHIDPRIALQFMGNFLYLFFSSTMLGVIVSPSLYYIDKCKNIVIFLGIT